MVRVASDICGAHAQMAVSAELMLGLRLQGATRQDVRRALWKERSLVKTVGLRGTLHLFAAEDVPMWMAANRLRFPAEEIRVQRTGIDMREFLAVADAIASIVGPAPIGRPDLERELEARVGGWATTTNPGWMNSYKNWPAALGWAAAQGAVCYGPGEGGRSTFVRLADWSGWREVPPMEGGRFALRKFLHAYGPSTQAEFSRWFALQPPITKALFESLTEELVEVDVEGSRRWMPAVELDVPAEPHPDAVRLLPHFDVYVVGSHPRELLMDPRSPVTKVSPGTAAPFAVLLVGGRVSGVWERKPKGKKLLIRVGPHRPLSRRQRSAVEAEAERIAAILERECEVELGEVALRPHL